MKKRRIAASVLGAALALFSLAALDSPAIAASDCIITPVGSTLVLANNCFTDVTITVPDGFTLDGGGHTITAQDPVAGHFVGAVISNLTAASTIHVTNVTITATLGDVCDAGVNRLRGILLSGASGTVTNTNVTQLRQGLSGCQEGNAIEARNFFPDEALSSATRTQVSITDNHVDRYQKTGILVNGDVDAIVGRNLVEGDGPITFIAQNGIQIGFGATALVSANSISGNNYTPTTFFSCGILIIQTAGVDAKPQDNLFPPNNAPNQNERDLCTFSKGGNYEPFGR